MYLRNLLKNIKRKQYKINDNKKYYKKLKKLFYECLLFKFNEEFKNERRKTCETSPATKNGRLSICNLGTNTYRIELK